MHTKGYAAPETKVAVEQARSLVEQAETRGEPPDDPLLLFSVLWGFWAANLVAFNADVCRDLAAHFLTLAEKQGAKVPLMIGHYVMATPLLLRGIPEARAHYDQAIVLYDPMEHRPLATRFGQDVRVTILSFRSRALWLLGCPDAALADVDQALKDAREIDQAASLMYALDFASFIRVCSGNYAAANVTVGQLVDLADEKGAWFWKATWNVVPRELVGPDRQGLGGSSNDHLRARRIAVNGSISVGAVVLVIFGEGLRGTRPIRRRCALH